jgi:hypothetical protein
MLELSVAPGIWPSCYRGIRGRETRQHWNLVVWTFDGIQAVLSGNVYSL